MSDWAPTAMDYAQAFDTERARGYPMIDRVEAELGACIERGKLERAARVLACPIKKHAPNWQHGRVLYAVARRRIETLILEGAPDSVLLLDIGTAKGFSALCLLWALVDAGPRGGGRVVSCDVIDPAARVRRNTVAELEGYLSLAETLAPWPEAHSIEFVKARACDWLTAHAATVDCRIHVASIDGKHSYEDVSAELACVARCQRAGDVIFLDDYQIPAVAHAFDEAKAKGLRPYDLSTIRLLPERAYVIARHV